MSKKDRLKAQKQKQDMRKKQFEEQERIEQEEAKEKHSKSARKMLKKAKKHRAWGEPVYYIILKILMLIPYGYSGFFYGGVLAVGIIGGYIDDRPPKWVAVCVIAGIICIGVGIIFAFFKKYIVSFVLTLGGTIPFMKSALYMIHKIQDALNTKSVETELQNMDKEYMMYYYPIMIVAAIGFILLVDSVIRKIVRKKKLQHEKDTAPVKSIIE